MAVTLIPIHIQILVNVILLVELVFSGKQVSQL